MAAVESQGARLLLAGVDACAANSVTRTCYRRAARIQSLMCKGEEFRVWQCLTFREMCTQVFFLSCLSKHASENKMARFAAVQGMNGISSGPGSFARI